MDSFLGGKVRWDEANLHSEVLRIYFSFFVLPWEILYYDSPLRPMVYMSGRAAKDKIDEVWLGVRKEFADSGGNGTSRDETK